MRLKKIKLAGFKSFVDATGITFPTSLTGIVGPNGCGKSNVIDAVRWVMGESSAKNLRGDSMADVIFNGSSVRKPVGVATIELLFDNSQGILGGQYAQYSEISIKRQVTRDGQSQYYLNGARCRRRDITDVFLGTGLGPRSYAIIEQGTISRLIEARPEELRIFLEEAAGISKYKERRRETETRIKHTRENLDRVNDLADEVTKRLRTLERQANTAMAYQQLKIQERETEAQLNVLKWLDLDQQAQNQSFLLEEKNNRLQEKHAVKFNVEAEIEKQRQAQGQAHEYFNEVQGRYYQIGSEAARVEQAITHHRERRSQVNQDVLEMETAQAQLSLELTLDETKIQETRLELAQIRESLQWIRQEEHSAAALFHHHEEALQEWQMEWDVFNEEAAQPSQAAQVQRAHIEQFEKKLQQLINRAEQLEKERKELSIAPIETDILAMEDQLKGMASNLQAAHQQYSSYNDQISYLRQLIQQDAVMLQETQAEFQEHKARLVSLEALQQAALGLDQQQTQQWLSEQGLSQAKRLVQILDVEPGWERAVEQVLGLHLEAICVEDMSKYAASLQQFHGSTVELLENGPNSNGNESGATVGSSAGASLQHQVKGAGVLRQMFENVYTAVHLDEALSRRFGLADHESLISRDGFWLGKHWLRLDAHAKDQQQSVLLREREIRAIQAQLVPLQQRIEALKDQSENHKNQLQSLEVQQNDLQRSIHQQQHQVAELKAELKGRSVQLENTKLRNERIYQELTELRQHIDREESDLKTAYQTLSEALEIMEQHAVRREQLNQQRDSLREQLSTARKNAQQSRDQLHDLELREESMAVSQNSMEQAILRLQNQLRQASSRIDELNDVLAKSQTPAEALNEQLNDFLHQKVIVEEQLAAQRRVVESLDDQLRQLNYQTSQNQQEIEVLRGEIDTLKLVWQELKVRGQTVLETLQSAGADFEQVRSQLPEEANTPLWHQNLESLMHSIQKLGLINLAAIDEFEQQKERKIYLDNQLADLNEALTTLEDAIRKIDKETRSRFQDTFDKVNVKLKELFPQLFGGGQAYMDMTSEDLLDCGITIMARPPGKRNSTIHLLSGGEKALTAVALVFSLFSLNPAPFCMLDEVDAPLDEANVGRFCQLVREMAEKVQFIFITHNKVTMEMAHQLVGVTMHEPGVSRLVVVDVDEAVQLATG